MDIGVVANEEELSFRRGGDKEDPECDSVTCVGATARTCGLERDRGVVYEGEGEGEEEWGLF